MPHISSTQARIFHPDADIRVEALVSPGCGATDPAVWRVHLGPGAASPSHRLTREEVFVALAGRADATIDDETHRVAAGDALLVPAGADFRIATAGDEPFSAVCCLPVGGQGIVGDDRFTPPWAE